MYTVNGDSERLLKSASKKKDERYEKLTPKGKGELVLLVEDDPAVLDLAKNMIERIGYRVIKANHPEEAIKLAEKHCDEIMLLLTDIVMPNMHGKELAKHITGLCPKIRILFMSGYTADVIAHHGVLDENISYIQKPFSSDNIAQKIREVLASENPA